MSVEIEGLDDLEAELKGLAEGIERAGGEIPMTDLFTDEFMKSFTQFDSLGAFFDGSPWSVRSESDFDAIPADEFDAYIEGSTNFDSWDTMVRVAGREFLLREVAER